MNILWLYRYTQHRHYNHWFHSDFARVISEQDNINLKMYGYRIHEREDFEDLMLKPYEASLSMQQLKKEFDYDIVILDCWNRAYKTTATKEMWLPKGFKDINVPTIVIEGDYHNIKDPNWYQDLNIDLIFHRHFTNVRRAKEDLSIKSLWLPCSIDNTIFKPNPDIQRVNKFCAVGEMNNNVYEYRKRAMKILKNNNLIYKESLVREEKYLTCLQSYTGHLNGSSIYDLNIAKMFEIMASGSVLLTDEIVNCGMKELFPNNSYCTYKRDYSDLLFKANKIINDQGYRNYITKNAMKVINNKHTHVIRAKELINIIVKVFNLSYESNNNRKLFNGFFCNEKKILFVKQESIKLSNSSQEDFVECETVIIKEPIPIQDDYDKLLSNTNEKKLKQLYGQDVKICLLKNTCYEIIINGRVGNALNIAVDKLDKAKPILGAGFVLHKMPDNTKQFIYKNMILHVPCPIIIYLTDIYGKPITEKFKSKNKKLKLIHNVYKFEKR